MSRIGKLPVAIPEKVKAEITDNTVKIEGPKGSLSQTFDSSVSIEFADGEIRVSPNGENRRARAMYGTARSIISNMVEGVVNGFSKKLFIEGVGFRASVSGTNLNLALGYSHPIDFTIPEGVTVTVADNTKVTVEGADKQAVGACAARIKSFYPAEPYKGKGVRIEGEFVRRKEGKKTA
ncbi:50S ribosomal protein L6 [Puniceicoccus vermicola]|uniref:Large ribosomal subunit protein uL6 n=1 Tax=Puniceicoccus vermicola TaxID=388746 RepID=A0A7X1E5M1_9BACT|nr:50S ribosomal protein L6 [Puniceicoccus vermicola]MBC2603289.1 50S ribosomal protein L6 [Puniceicoccus vermicola]